MLPEPSFVPIFARGQSYKLHEHILLLLRRIVIATTPALVAECPPPLLERLPARPLPILDECDQVWLRQLTNFLGHQLLMLYYRLLMDHHFLMVFLVLVQVLEEVFLLPMFLHLLPRLPEGWKYLLLLIEAQAHCLTLRTRTLR